MGWPLKIMRRLMPADFLWTTGAAALFGNHGWIKNFPNKNGNNPAIDHPLVIPRDVYQRREVAGRKITV